MLEEGEGYRGEGDRGRWVLGYKVQGVQGVQGNRSAGERRRGGEGRGRGRLTGME